MLSKQLEKLLKKKKEFQELMEKLDTDNLTYDNAPDRYFMALTNSINESVKLFWRTSKISTTEKSKILRPTGLDERTLKRILGSDPSLTLNGKPINESELRRQKSINAILVFAGASRDLWDFYKDKSIANEILDKSFLIGDWYIYRQDGNDGIKRTALRISMSSKNKLTATYRSLHNSEFTEGLVSVNGHILTLSFSSDTKTIDISATVNDEILNAGKILNGIIRSTKDNLPYAVQCIMTYIGPELNNFVNEKAMRILHTSHQKPDMAEQVVQDPNIDPIVVYLLRKNKTISAKPFKPSSISGIVERNNVHYGEGLYRRYKSLLDGEWVSISPGNNCFKIVHWKIAFDDASHECHFKYSYKGQELHGGIFWQDNQIVFKVLDGYKTLRTITVIVNNEDADKPFFIGVSIQSSRSAKHDIIAYPEIFTRELKAHEQLNDIHEVDYETLLGLPFSNNEIKRSLLNHLAVPYNSEQTSFDTLTRYSGKYLAFIPNAYASDTKSIQSLLQITIKIDALGQVIEEIFLNPDKAKKTSRRYKGEAAIITNTLRLSNINNEGQRSEYIFSLPILLPETHGMLQGITLDTDINNRPCADACILVRHDFLFKRTSFEPKVLLSKSKEYEKLNAAMLKELKIGLNEYFFKLYPSIRYKKKETKRAQNKKTIL